MSEQLLDTLRALYNPDPAVRRPKPGERAIVEGLEGEHTVEGFDGKIFTLRSDRGAVLKAGLLRVRRAE